MDYVSLLTPLINKGIIEFEIIYTETGTEFTAYCWFNDEHLSSRSLKSRKAVKGEIYEKVYKVIYNPYLFLIMITVGSFT